MKNRGLTALLTLSVLVTSVIPPVSVQAETVSENSVEEVVFMDDTAPGDGSVYDDVSAEDDTAVSGNDAGKSDAEEFYGGYIPSGISYGFPENGLADDEFAAECASASMRRYDPRETGMVSGAREQVLGSCWAYASMAAVESNLIKNGFADNTIDLSELQMMWFMNRPYEDPLGNYTPEIMHPGMSVRDFINHGGNSAEAAAFLSRWTGPVLESEAPLNRGMYKKENEVSGFPPQIDYNLLNNITVDESLATKSYWHMEGAKFCDYDIEHIQNVKELVSVYGGAVIGIYNGYENVTEDNTEYTQYAYEGRTANHEVEVIGWDDDYPKENFIVTAPENGAWLVKDSASTLGSCLIGTTCPWTGYKWVSYYDKSISDITAFNFTNKDTYENLYAYDGDCLYIGGGEYPDASLDNTDYDKKSMNMFTAKAYGNGEVERVDAVMIRMRENSNYEITVYVNPEIRNNVITGYSGKSSTTKGRTDYFGYYTVELDEPAYVKEGDTFAVVLGGRSTPCVRGLTNKAENYIFSESLTVNKTNVSLKVGESDTVNAAVLPATATNPTAGFYTSNPEVATVDGNGRITATGAGSCIITAKSYDGRQSRQVSVTVTKPAGTGAGAGAGSSPAGSRQPAIGTAFKNRSLTYKVTGKDTVSVTDIKDVKSVIIPTTVYHADTVYKVTEIGKGAAKGNKKLEKVTIGSNVTKIGSKAFNNCPKLKKVTIKSGSLKKVGSGAFKKIKENAVIKVPKSKLKEYRKLIGKKTDGSVTVK